MGERIKLTIKIGSKRKTFQNLRDAAKALKMPYGVLYQRLFIMGWPTSKAVKTKIRKKAKTKSRRKK